MAESTSPPSEFVSRADFMAAMKACDEATRASVMLADSCEMWRVQCQKGSDEIQRLGGIITAWGQKCATITETAKNECSVLLTWGARWQADSKTKEADYGRLSLIHGIANAENAKLRKLTEEHGRIIEALKIENAKLQARTTELETRLKEKTALSPSAS